MATMHDIGRTRVLRNLRQYERIKQLAEGLDRLQRVGRDVYLLGSVTPEAEPASPADFVLARTDMPLPNQR